MAGCSLAGIVFTKFEEPVEVQGIFVHPIWFPFGSVTSSTMGECPCIIKGESECPCTIAFTDGLAIRLSSRNRAARRRVLIVCRALRSVTAFGI